MSWLVICCSILDAFFIIIEMCLYCVSPSLELWNALEVQKQCEFSSSIQDKTAKTTSVNILHWVLSINNFCLDKDQLSVLEALVERIRSSHLNFLVRIEHLLLSELNFTSIKEGNTLLYYRWCWLKETGKQILIELSQWQVHWDILCPVEGDLWMGIVPRVTLRLCSVVVSSTLQTNSPFMTMGHRIMLFQCICLILLPWNPLGENGITDTYWAAARRKVVKLLLGFSQGNPWEIVFSEIRSSI